MKKIYFIFVGLLLLLVTSCSNKIEYNENDYVHPLTSIIDAKSSYKYKNAVPDEMVVSVMGYSTSSTQHLESRSKIKQAYAPLKKLRFKYVQKLSKEEQSNFYLSFGVAIYYDTNRAYIAITNDGTVIFCNIDSDYFVTETNSINLEEYAGLFV